MSRLVVVAVACAALSCMGVLDVAVDSTPAQLRDAGVFDAGAFDAGTVDGGNVETGAVDSGVVDAGPIDAGTETGPIDAGVVPPNDGGCSFPQGLPEMDFIANDPTYTDTDPTVDSAVDAVIESITGCSRLSRCLLKDEPGTTVDEQCQAFFVQVTQALRSEGFCAGQHELGSTDEIAVSNTGCTGKWYGYHICNYGGPVVAWNPGARRGWWEINPARCP